MTSLEALGRIADVGAVLANNNAAMFVDVMTEVLMGFRGDASVLRNWGISFLGKSAYWVGDVFTDSGFHPGYQDNDNQVYHFWFYVAVAFQHGWDVAIYGNTNHESWVNFTFWEKFTGGESVMDWKLGYMGALLGDALRKSYVDVGSVGTWVMNNLSQPFTACEVYNVFANLYTCR